MTYFTKLKRYISTNISCKLTSLILAGLLVTVLPVFGIYVNNARESFLQSEIEELLEQTTQTTDSNRYFLQIALPQLQTLSLVLQQKLITSPLQIDIDKEFNKRFEQFDDGAWRNRREKFNGMMQSGLFLPPDVELDTDKKRFFLTAISVFDLFGAATTSNPIFDNIWMLGHDRSEVIFDRSYPDFVYMMKTDTDYTQTPWMQLVSPQNDPDRKARWTPALFDPVSKSWLVSVVYPLDINGMWLATLGMDLDINEVLLPALRSLRNKYRDELNFLVDNKDNFILAGNWQQQLEQQSDTFHIPSQETELIAILNKPFFEKTSYLGSIQVAGTQYEVINRLIQPMGWHYLRLVPTNAILAPFYQGIMQTSLMFVVLILMIVVLFSIISRKLIVRPLLQIVNNVKAFVSGEKIIPIERDDELGQLNDALIEMHEEIEKDTEQLLNSEKRYRQVVTSIHETLFQINRDKEWQFLSPTWRELSGYDLRHSLYKSIGHFFHVADKARVHAIINELFSGIIHNWHGEVRLRRANNRSVWVTLSLNRDDSNKEAALSGTIENSHFQHISNAMTKLIQGMEQKVMTSYCSLETILEFVTGELLSILDISLVWVKLCHDNTSQILAHNGDIATFLYENDRTWSGLHQEEGPVMLAIREHRVLRLNAFDTMTPEWQQRLNYDEIKDSLFIPFYLAGGHTQAVIGLHSRDEQVFDHHLQKIMTEFSVSLRLICQMIEDQGLMRLHRTAVENVANAIMITDNHGKIEWVNDAFSKQTLYTMSEVIGQTPEILNSNLPESNSHVEKMWKTIKSGQVWSGEIINRRKDGALISVYQTVTPLFDDIGSITHYISVSEDVTERNEQIKRIAFMATHDELTQLPNRTLLDDRLNQAIAHAKRQQSLVAVLFVDIDHFKYINDSLGHQIGDELLKTLAKRFASVLRQEDTIARFGGDEFVIVLPEVNDINCIKTITYNLLQEIKKPFHIMEHELIITGSIGISLYPDDGDTTDDLIQNADSAMYQAKEQGRNTSQFYTAEINEKITRRLTLEKALRKAIHNQEFVLFYQPKVDLQTRSIVGLEALIRWEHPQEGIVSPAEFIPLAEETGVILEIGNWVIERACRQMKIWQSTFIDLKNISINVSARQFWQDDFIEKVAEIIDKTAVNAHQIEFELTESIVMNDMEQAITMMKKIRDMGISLSIDDFGTGYSSLSYLQNLPIDVLKIDRSFVNDLTDESSDSAIIRSIMALADNFNLKVVAEGIEKEFQQKILAKLGCQFGQGYLYSRPVNVEEINKMLANKNRW